VSSFGFRVLHWTVEEAVGAVDTTRPSLLLRIRDRADADAWETFDAIYRPMLYRLARARGVSDADAEDVTQHCMGAVSDHIHEFSYDPTKGRFKGWLRTLVNNRVRDLLRKRREASGKTQLFGNLPETDPSPADAFDEIWIEEHLGHCLRLLREESEEKTYLAFQHYVIEERPIEQVCAELGLEPNNVHTIKWRMTQRIAARMKELLGDDE
jgi:RNA polymerase sigma-70 factor (ECF subfamily)